MAERLFGPPAADPTLQPWPPLRCVRVAGRTVWWLPTPGRRSAALALGGPLAGRGGVEPPEAAHLGEHLIAHLRLAPDAPPLRVLLRRAGAEWNALCGPDWWLFHARVPTGETGPLLRVLLEHLERGRPAAADMRRESRRLGAETALVAADPLERLRARLLRAAPLPPVGATPSDVVTVVADVVPPAPLEAAHRLREHPPAPPPSVRPRPHRRCLRPPRHDAADPVLLGVVLPLGCAGGDTAQATGLFTWLERDLFGDPVVEGGAYLAAAALDRARAGDRLWAAFACEGREVSGLWRRLSQRLEELAGCGPSPEAMVELRSRLLLDLAVDLDDPLRFVMRATARLLRGEPAGPDDEAAAIARLDPRALGELLQRACAARAAAVEPLLPKI